MDHKYGLQAVDLSGMIWKSHEAMKPCTAKNQWPEKEPWPLGLYLFSRDT